MKILILIMMFTMATCFKPVNAAEYSLHVSEKFRNVNEDLYSTGTWLGLEFKYQPDNSDIYYFISTEHIAVVAKMRAFNYDMTGFGVGKRYQVAKNIRVFGQAGYYLIDNSWGAKKREFNEGLYYYLNDRWIHSNGGGYLVFDEYGVENKNTFGGTIGIEFSHKLSKNIDFSMIFSKRFMKIREKLAGYRDAWNGGSWEFNSDRDYSTTDYSLGINYVF